MTPCIRFDCGIICGEHPEYEFDGFLFEWHRVFGPASISRRTHDPRVTTPVGFWPMVKRFEALSKEERESFRVEGKA